ncbi:polysaccharide biosynthesis/export family protein [Sphingomonas sp. MMS24-J13]|uniref:polysaccharide biosynthesis/export family protein n=1 Tax=Sphingomonas sp. MMS24-J13 TaxID=3238686 RepID=UPI00384BAC75
MSATALPAPSGNDTTHVPAYLVGPYDKLRIDVYGIEELQQRIVQVDASGRLSFPLAGTIEVAGKTPNQVAGLIAGRLAGEYVRDPQVTVNLEQTVSQVVAVDGQVKEPGLYPVVGRMTLMRIVATAKGLTELANQTDVVVFRTVNGQKLAALYNLRAIRRGAYSDPDIYADDVVVVGDSKARQIFKDLISSATLLSTPLIIAFR